MFHASSQQGRKGLVIINPSNVYIATLRPTAAPPAPPPPDVFTTRLTQTVAELNAGETINILPATYTIPSGEFSVINKGLKIKGAGVSSLLQVSGTTSLGTLQIAAAGVTLEDFAITKTDLMAANQSPPETHNIIGVNGNNFTARGLTITGQGPGSGNTWSGLDAYAFPNFANLFTPNSSGRVVRGFNISAGLTGLLIENSTFTNVRQPAYVNPDTIGQIKNNTASGTRGWVVQCAPITFTGNKFSNTEAADIAMLRASYTGATTGLACTNSAYQALNTLTIAANNSNTTYSSQAIISDQRNPTGP